VQYRSNLNAASSWLTLTDNFPAANNTNLTFFLHSNGVSGVGGTNRGTGFYRVVRDGAHLFGITNGMTLSGVVTIPVEVANGAGTLVNLSLTEDDAPVSGFPSQAPPIPLPLQLTVDTTRMSNGVHQISASARWDDTNGGVWEADSPPVTINVYNEISFPHWMPRFGELYDSLFISFQSAHTDADWYVDVYDSQYSYIGTFGDHTYDGNVEFAWNLIGPYNEYHADNTFYFVVTTVFNSSSLAQSSAPTSNDASPDAGSGYASVIAPPTWKVDDPWSGSGAWVAVAQHAFDYIIGHDLLYQELKGFVGAAQGVGWPVYPPPGDDGEGNMVIPFAVNFQNGSEAGDWATFRSALYNSRSRNLVYFGHAGPNNLGYNWSDTNVSISATEIANRLHTIPDTQTNRHAFRFVFLDGCSTAKGTLPEAFGIACVPIPDLDVYSAAAIRPSAFVGWDADKHVGLFFWLLFSSHVNFIVHIQERMMLNSDGIQDAINNAARAPDVNWTLWTSEMKVFGYTGLTLGEENN